MNPESIHHIITTAVILASLGMVNGKEAPREPRTGIDPEVCPNEYIFSTSYEPAACVKLAPPKAGVGPGEISIVQPLQKKGGEKNVR